MKKLQDLLRSSKESLQEALAEAEVFGDPGVYNQVDEALASVENLLEDLPSLAGE